MVNCKFFTSFSQFHVEKSGNLLCLQNQMLCHSQSAQSAQIAKIPADFAAKKEKYSCITVIWQNTQGMTI